MWLQGGSRTLSPEGLKAVLCTGRLSLLHNVNCCPNSQRIHKHRSEERSVCLEQSRKRTCVDGGKDNEAKKHGVHLGRRLHDTHDQRGCKVKRWSPSLDMMLRLSRKMLGSAGPGPNGHGSEVKASCKAGKLSLNITGPLEQLGDLVQVPQFIRRSIGRVDNGLDTVDI